MENEKKQLDETSPEEMPPEVAAQVAEALDRIESAFEKMSPEEKQNLIKTAPAGFQIVQIMAALAMQANFIYKPEFDKEIAEAETRRGRKLTMLETADATTHALFDWIDAGAPGRSLRNATAGAFILERFRQYIGENDRPAWRKIPVAQEFHTMWQYMAIGPEGLATYTARKNKNRHGAEYRLEKGVDGNYTQLTIQGRETAVSVQPKDLSNFSGDNVDARRIFTFTLERMNQEAQFRGRFFSGAISYTLQDLVNNGLYNSTAAARRGFLLAASLLTGFRIGSIKNLNSKKAKNTTVDMKVLFTGFSLKRGVCTLTLNNELAFDTRAGGFSLLPGYYYELKDRPGKLWNLISFYARQASNLRKLAKNARFAITVKTLQAELALPGLKKAKNAGRDIRGAIEKTVAETLDEQARRGNADELRITISDETDAREFLDHGKIIVEFAGAILEYYTALHAENERTRAAAIEAAKQKRAAAIARNIAKKAVKRTTKNGDAGKASADKEKTGIPINTPKE